MKKDNLAWRMAFANRLNESMEKAKMNNTELSQKTSIGKSDISNYLKAKYMPKQDRVFLMAKALGVDPVWLYALDVKYKMEAMQDVATPEETLAYITDNHTPIVSTEPWNPDETMLRDESFVIMARGMAHMSPEKRKRLVEAAKALFSEDFDEEGHKKE